MDRGGTFTDVVVREDDGRVVVRKVPSDAAVVGDLARGPLVFGTTVATNALLERRRARTALLVTRGFADLVRIGDMTRPSLFDPDARRPEPLCDVVIEVDGRVARDGERLEPLVLPDPEALGDVGAAAVVLLHSGRFPEDEDAVAAALPDGVDVAVGHESSPEIGYLGRVETTLVDAAITPILRDALDRDRIPADALAVRSDGSLCPAAALRAADAVLSGPASGVVAVEAIARQAGFASAVGLDMGGTSTDVCRVDVGRLPRRAEDARVAGVRVRRPMLEVETIAAGGGSILANDGRKLMVGPASAGADPGPQCYGRGGPPTLTDAALVAGLVDPAAFSPPLDPSKIALPGDADAFLEVAREAMAAAVRRLATERGVDLRGHALVAYGGAAGQHAAPIAAKLGIETVLVHPYASVLCAWGQSLMRREEAGVVPLWKPWPECHDEALARARALAEDVRARLGDVAEVEARPRTSRPAVEEDVTVSLRTVGTDHAIEVDLVDDVEAVRAAWAAEHERRWGFRRSGALEAVDVRVRVRGPAPVVPVIEDDPWGVGDRVVDGPVVLSTPTTSILVPEGWTARHDRGLLRLDHQALPAPPPATERTPLGVALWSSRFVAVAEQAGGVLRRLARSVNIRERLDFSCAVFDGDGHLVANAPHVPVHLGAMGETVRDLIARGAAGGSAVEAGQAYLCNDPWAGGSHLPDLTVVTPVAHEGRRFFVACRGHHADVGGITPGSMPPSAHRIEEEGFVVRHLPLLDGGKLADVRRWLVGCRQPDTVLADLEAQIAANAHAARLLTSLAPADVVAAWMAHLQDVADEAVTEATADLADGVAEDVLGGVPLRLALRREASGRSGVGRDVLVVDLCGTGGPHAGNLNAPRAVVRAAVLYGLRVLVRRPIPLVEGALRHVRIDVPAGSIVDPPVGAAVAGGNVETSQRLVDLFLRAAGHMAASAGTMSNLTLGGAGWAFYETLGGGQGASPRGDGPSARQLHMTNTRATDPEVLEERLPMRVRQFSIRAGSGGEGRHRGGDGLVREIEVTAPATAALLATRRDRGAPGLDGGGEGLPAVDEVCRGGDWRPWDGSSASLAPGDRVRVATPGGGGWG